MVSLRHRSCVLYYRPDPKHPGHGFIEPAYVMTADNFNNGGLYSHYGAGNCAIVQSKQMAIPDGIEKALRSTRPFEELRAIATALFAEGRTEKAVYDLFETVRTQLRLEAREAEEDVVMEVMDCLVGWCSPHQELKANAQFRSVNEPTSPGQAAWGRHAQIDGLHHDLKIDRDRL